MQEIEIRIKRDEMRFIYSDALRPLMAEGKSRTIRASHVEPQDDGWIADMSPVKGPVLGPFALRNDALVAEVAWLKEHKIPIPNS